MRLISGIDAANCASLLPKILFPNGIIPSKEIDTMLLEIRLQLSDDLSGTLKLSDKITDIAASDPRFKKWAYFTFLVND